MGIEDYKPDVLPGFGSKLLAAQPFWVTVAAVLICVVLSVLQPDSFATADNFFNITRNFAYIGIMALGMTAVIITGGIDLSVGSMVALLGILFLDVMIERDLGWPLAVVAAILGGTLLGTLHGLLITRLKLQPFVVTLCGLLLYRGIARWYDQVIARLSR